MLCDAAADAGVDITELDPPVMFSRNANNEEPTWHGLVIVVVIIWLTTYFPMFNLQLMTDDLLGTT